MKQNRGITLISLMIYIIGMLIVIGIISTLTSFFYKNIDITNIGENVTGQYTNFSSIFVYEINKENNKVVDCKISEENGFKISYIIFSSGNQYTFKEENNAIYKNGIKVCENVEDCDFSYTFVDSKYNIKVNFKTSNIDMTNDKAITYIMK